LRCGTLAVNAQKQRRSNADSSYHSNQKVYACPTAAKGTDASGRRQLGCPPTWCNRQLLI